MGLINHHLGTSCLEVELKDQRLRRAAGRTESQEPNLELDSLNTINYTITASTVAIKTSSKS